MAKYQSFYVLIEDWYKKIRRAP